MSTQICVVDILKKFRMEKCKLPYTTIAHGIRLCKDGVKTIVNSTLYKQLAGSLMYLTTTREDITFAVNYISRFMGPPEDSHWKAAKRKLRYIAGKTTHAVWYTYLEYNVLVGYIDSDFASSIDNRKCTSGYVFLVSINMISWVSKK